MPEKQKKPLKERSEQTYTVAVRGINKLRSLRSSLGVNGNKRSDLSIIISLAAKKSV